MKDMNLEEKLQFYWQESMLAYNSRDFRRLQGAYWGIYHLLKNKEPELPVIKA